MKKLYTYSERKEGLPDVAFFCPACNCLHGVWITQTNKNNAVWVFNGDYEKPTFEPSLKITTSYAGKILICHLFIRNGMIEYCTDSTHELAGKIVEIPDID